MPITPPWKKPISAGNTAKQRAALFVFKYLNELDGIVTIQVVDNLDQLFGVELV